MLRAYKFRLYPNKEQKEYFTKCFGCVRFSNNSYFDQEAPTSISRGSSLRKFTAEKVSKQGILTFQEARKEILNGIKEVKQILLGEIEEQIKSANDDIKSIINKFNI